MYKNILEKQTKEYNIAYKCVKRQKPSLSLKDKEELSLALMAEIRGLDTENLLEMIKNPLRNSTKFQYCCEIMALQHDIKVGINRFYVKDESLFDFFKNTELKHKEVESILKSDFLNTEQYYICGVIGQNISFTLMSFTMKGNHVITILTDEMNYTFVAEFIENAEDKWVFNMAMNFLFYIQAFPECVVDGVPQGVKRNSNSKTIAVSDKIVSHTTVEHGFVRPHFRSGYFRHLNSDYFVNCKGQVRFIASTMVKGKAKTVISKEN